MADTQYQYYESRFTGQEIDDNLTLVKNNMNNLLEKVGDDQKGLVKDVADLKNKVNAGTGGANSADVEALKEAVGEWPYVPTKAPNGDKLYIVDRLKALEMDNENSETNATLISDVSTLKTDVSTLKTDVSTLKGYHGAGGGNSGGGSGATTSFLQAITATGTNDFEVNAGQDGGVYQRINMTSYAPLYSPVADQETSSLIGQCYYQTDLFNISNGVIKILQDGWYLVGGGTYCLTMPTTITSAQAAIFVDKKNSSQTINLKVGEQTFATYADVAASETTNDRSTWKFTYTDHASLMENQLGEGQRYLRFISSAVIHGPGAVAIPNKFTRLYAGDEIQLKVRVVGSDKASFRADSHSTQITLIKIA